jgi:hydrogenase expression/formation protein HypC
MCLGTLGTITRTWDAGGVPMAAVEASARQVDACLLYHPDASVGDPVLVHMGFVVDVLDDETATDARDLRAGMAGRPNPAI